VSIETEDETGDVLAVYFQIRKGRHDHTKQFENGAAIADYDKHGYLLGLELLAPCKVRVVDELAKAEPRIVRSSVKRFMRQSGPRELVMARQRRWSLPRAAEFAFPRRREWIVKDRPNASERF